MMESIRTVFTPSNVSFMMEGLKLALLISIGVVIFSILFGTVLGLLRNYEKKVFGNQRPPVVRAVSAGVSLSHRRRSGKRPF